MPEIAIESRQRNIGDDRANTQRFAGKAYAERPADEAATAIRSNQIPCPDPLFTTFADEARVYAIVVLLQSDQFTSEFDSLSKLHQPFSHYALSQKLRNHERNVIRLRRRWLAASSMARASPAAPAPQINTSVTSFAVMLSLSIYV
jgi:hypothetical protein